MKTIQHTNTNECREAFLEQFENCHDIPWIGVVATFDGGKLDVHRTTAEFPRSQIRPFIEMLKTLLESEAEVDTGPLPIAKFAIHSEEQEEQEEQT